MPLPMTRHGDDDAPAIRSTSVWDALWAPFGELEPFFRRLPWLSESGRGSEGWSPVAEHERAPDAFIVRLELPGVPQRNVHVELNGRGLCVSGELGGSERREGMLARRVGRFVHRTALPSSADPERVTAWMSDGVLTVRVPKSEAVTRRSVPISDGESADAGNDEAKGDRS